jgi:energy-converting hydrogenase B subunit D
MISHVILLILFALSALLAVEFKDLIYAAVALGMCSLCLALLFYQLQAPDVAMTEVAIGAALSTFILLLAINHTRRVSE